MRTFRKSLLSIVLTAFFMLLAVSMQVFVVHADTGSGSEAVIVETGTEYAGLNDAKGAVQKGQTIKLLKDIDLGTGYLYTGGNYVLDLNGHSITSSASSDADSSAKGVIWLASNYSSLTVKDSSPEKSGAVISTGNWYSVFTQTDTTLVIESGNFISSGNGILCGGDVTINGGRTEADRTALHHFHAGKTVTINGGVIKGRRTLDYVTWNNNYGGTFVVNGGYFSDDVANYPGTIRKTGMKLFKVGGKGEYKDYYELRTEVAGRVSGDSEITYDDLQEAVSSAAAGDRVVVLADCEADSLLIDKGITLDLNGKTVTETGVMKGKAGTITIKDSGAAESGAGTGRIDFTKEDENFTFDVIGSSSKLLLESGTLNAAGSGAIRVSEGAEVMMTGGTVSAGKCGIYAGVNSGSIYKGKVTINGGAVSGREYGVYVFNGSAIVNGDTAIVTSDGKSVGMKEGQEFIINGGKYSDGEGNADGFTRSGGRYLCGFTENNVRMYKLGTAEAYNETTGEYFDDLGNVKDFTRGDDNAVKVIRDINRGSEAVYMSNKFVLDLNGHTITGNVNDRNKGVLCLTDEGELTITDSSRNKTGAVINNYDRNTDEGYAIWIDEDTELTIEDGTVKSNNAGIHCGETIIMNGGKIDAGGRAIYLFPFDTSVVINDGILKCGDDDPVFYFPYNRPGPEVTINGGYFSNDSINNEARISRKDNMLLIKVGGSGEYRDYYELKAVVAKVVSGENETFLGELQEAVNRAAAGDTVVVLADCETDSLLINKGITLDLNGKTVTEKGVMKTTGVTLTIKDSGAAEGAEGSGRIDFTKEGGGYAFDVTGIRTKLLLQSGTLNAAGSGAIRVSEGADIEMTGGTVSGGKNGIYIGGASESKGILSMGEISGGTISGTEYGIYLYRGIIRVLGDAAVIGAKDRSVGVNLEDSQPVLFSIEGGRYSDAAGNGREFLRLTDRNLADPDGDGWYELTDGTIPEISNGVGQGNDDGEPSSAPEISVGTGQGTEEGEPSSADGNDPKPGTDPNRMGKDGTAVGPGASAAAADKAITSAADEEGPEGTRYAIVALRSARQGRKNVALTWNKVKGAESYVVYGNVCGRKHKMKKLATVKTGKYNVRKISKKLKKGTYYKFIVVALDSNKNVVSTSKVVHAATKGGKVTNYSRVSVRKSVINKAKKLREGKTLKLQAGQIRQSKGKVKKHRALSYESSNTGIASVSRKGVVKGKAKGSCYITAYTQSGTYRRIKVTVR